MAISDSTPLSVVPANATDMKSKTTWIMSGSEIKKNGITIKENYAPSLERLEVNVDAVLSVIFKTFLKKFLLDQGPFCGATDCSYFGLCVTLPMGFKARVVLSPAHLLACMQ